MGCMYPLYAFRDLSQSMALSVSRGKRKSNIVFCESREARDAYCASSRMFIPLDLSCGQCIGCRLKQSSEWRTRLCCESLTAGDSLFITWTYDDEHLPYSSLGFPTLSADDIRSLNRNLTQRFVRDFGFKSPRHFICGEYGDSTQRPHYHSIHFNIHPEKLGLRHLFDRAGESYFESDYLESVWQRGFVVVSSFNPVNAAYVARYCTKKLTGEKNQERFDSSGRMQEFIRCSNRPALGRLYFDSLLDDPDRVWESLSIPVNGLGVIQMPQYFQSVFADFDEPLFSSLKANRNKVIKVKQDAALAAFGGDYDKYLESQRLKLFKASLKLKRDQI